MHSLISIIGPTASGKSALAMGIARRIQAELLCVDSMTVYQDMSIGTAKPDPQEREEVRHHLIDVVTPDQEFTVARFVELADRSIADARSRNIPLIAVGGTPMYFKSLFEGLFEGPGADLELRARLASEPIESLYQRMCQVDPAARERIHANDLKRIIRALEVYELTGKPISDHQKEWGVNVRHKARWIGIQWDREALSRRINARVKQMIQAGWLDEVRLLLARYPALSKTAAEATGYRELILHLQGKQTLDDAIEQIKIGTRQLSRRQIKWFRRFENVLWLDGSQPLESLVEKALTHLRHE